MSENLHDTLLKFAILGFAVYNFKRCRDATQIIGDKTSFNGVLRFMVSKAHDK